MNMSFPNQQFHVYSTHVSPTEPESIEVSAGEDRGDVALRHWEQ